MCSTVNAAVCAVALRRQVCLERLHHLAAEMTDVVTCSANFQRAVYVVTELSQSEKKAQSSVVVAKGDVQLTGRQTASCCGR